MKDANGDGRINVEEFRSLMKAIGDEVSGDTVATMFDSMDIHNSLDFDEFIAILEVGVRSLPRIPSASWLWCPGRVHSFPFADGRNAPICSETRTLWGSAEVAG